MEGEAWWSGCPLTSTGVLLYAKNATGRTLVREGREVKRRQKQAAGAMLHTQPQSLCSRAAGQGPDASGACPSDTPPHPLHSYEPMGAILLQTTIQFIWALNLALPHVRGKHFTT